MYAMAVMVTRCSAMMNAYDFGPDLADVTAEYMAENAPYTPYTDRRITVIGN